MTIQRLMGVVACFHSHFTRELRKSFKFGHDLDFLIGGKCPATGVVKLFRFIASEHEGDPRFEEVLLKKPFSYSAIGAGEPRFCRRLEEHLARGGCRVHFTVFSCLRDVINDPEIPSVGGRVQCGAFEGGNFAHCGVLEYDLGGEQPVSLPSIRGLILDRVYDPKNFDDFHVCYAFKAPFEGDLEALFRRS